MRSKVHILIVMFLVLAGISVMAYPAMSNYLNTIHSSYAVRELSEQLSSLPSGELEAQRQLAEQYNAGLREDYDRIMDFGNGIMGYLQIPKLGVELAIYHGVSDAVLQKGAGHMPGSSLPIGGPGTHAVLTGHTGLPSAELFTDLTELSEGDLFYITALGETLAYEVDQITVVLPQEAEGLAPSPGRDYCTLVTCTPYGINSHRLLVRGERVRPDPQMVAQQTQTPARSRTQIPPELLLAGSGAALVLTWTAVVLLRQKRRDRKTDAEESP